MAPLGGQVVENTEPGTRPSARALTMQTVQSQPSTEILNNFMVRE